MTAPSSYLHVPDLRPVREGLGQKHCQQPELREEGVHAPPEGSVRYRRSGENGSAGLGELAARRRPEGVMHTGGGGDKLAA